MKTLRFDLVLGICLVCFSLAACSSEETVTSNEPVTTQPETTLPPEPPAPLPLNDSVQQSAGELREVDLAARTLTIRNVDGGAETFSFTESTEISGVADVQGLSVQEGNQVMVSYTGEDGRKTAVRIQVIPK